MSLVVFYTVFLPQDHICFYFILLPVGKDDILKVNVNVAVSYYFLSLSLFQRRSDLPSLSWSSFHLSFTFMCPSCSFNTTVINLLSLSFSRPLFTCSCFLLPLLNSLFLEFRDVRVINTSEGAEGSFGIVYFLQQ